MRLKGVRFPSWNEAKASPPHRVFLPHIGLASRIRNLRQLCRSILNDPANKELLDRVRERVKESVKTPREQEFGFLYLVSETRRIAKEGELPWADLMEYNLERFGTKTPVVIDDKGEPVEQPVSEG